MRKQKFNDNWIFRTGGGSSLEALAGGDRAGKMVTLPLPLVPPEESV